MEKLTGFERGRFQVMCPSPSSQATNRRAMTSLKAGAFEKLMMILVVAGREFPKRPSNAIKHFAVEHSSRSIS